jgi:hypothetical protein
MMTLIIASALAAAQSAPASIPTAAQHQHMEHKGTMGGMGDMKGMDHMNGMGHMHMSKKQMAECRKCCEEMMAKMHRRHSQHERHAG